MERTGVIYILTNPSFPQYVKIGYASDVEKRLEELNRSTAVPFAFRIYATYEVNSVLSDKKLHAILDKLNPDLRSTEEIDGKRRIREFYAMTPEDAYAILEAIAEINGFSHRLKKWKASESEQIDEELAQEINERHRERSSPFSFSKFGIAIGESVEFFCNGNEYSGLQLEVIDDRHVRYNGEAWALSYLTRHLRGKKTSIVGWKYYRYKGETLEDIARRLGM